MDVLIADLHLADFLIVEVVQHDVALRRRHLLRRYPPRLRKSAI